MTPRTEEPSDRGSLLEKSRRMLRLYWEWQRSEGKLLGLGANVVPADAGGPVRRLGSGETAGQRRVQPGGRVAVYDLQRGQFVDTKDFVNKNFVGD